MVIREEEPVCVRCSRRVRFEHLAVFILYFFTGHPELSHCESVSVLVAVISIVSPSLLSSTVRSNCCSYSRRTSSVSSSWMFSMASFMVVIVLFKSAILLNFTCKVLAVWLICASAINFWSFNSFFCFSVVLVCSLFA